jgi:hypothetical protein
MSNTVFILGAGASKDAGAPLMADFLDRAHDLWKTGKVKDAEVHFDTVFKGISALQAVHSKSQLNISNVESVFSAFEMAKTLKAFPDLPSHKPKKLIDSMKVVIGRTIEETIQIPVEISDATSPKPYGAFMRLINHLKNKAQPNHEISVITFNYDLACDFSFYKNGIYIDYALGEETARIPIPFLKLHGSLNWVRCPELKKIVPWTMQSYFKRFSWSFILNEKSLKLHMMKHLEEFKYIDSHAVKPEPVLVPPTWNKTEYYDNLSNVWSRAARELSKSENIFIIGYSLPETDQFFRYLYALGTVGTNLLNRIWVYNPDVTGDVERRFKEMLGPAAEDRFKYIAKGFVEAIEHIFTEFPQQ